jgi:cyanophycinase
MTFGNLFGVFGESSGETRSESTLSNPSTQGFLVLIGGNEDKRDAKKVLRRVATLRPSACVAVIPTASMYGAELGEEYVDLFLRMNIGITKGHVLDVRDAHDAANPALVIMIEEADVIFFTGGDQVRLVQAFAGSAVMQAIYTKFAQGATVAGTSAGAAAASNPMMYDGDEEGFNKGSVQQCEGFGFLPHITMDTHFLQRNRIPRLAQMLSRGSSKFGVGLDEDTAIIVQPNLHCEVIGSAMVTFMHANHLRYSNYNDVRNGALYATDGLDISFLTEGMKFDLNTWQVLV